MCFGGKDNRGSIEDFTNCISIYERFKYGSRITSSNYIDPFGYKYERSMVNCIECIFKFRDGCVLYKEKGYDEIEIMRLRKDVRDNNYCDYFLIKDFSEGDNEDEIAERAVEKLRKG
ncbi:hypothetical protein MHK_006101 [Candidatus Magnetomorum sp. HK-1]|nr:hypothetical protein MHK_006101 [Candidatus Magnetomorum sp. HK-1]